MKERGATDYASHILEAISRIEAYTMGMTEPAFLASQLVQDAVIRNFEVIGEAAGNLLRAAPQIATMHPQIPWHLPRSMRNFLAHVYWSVDAVKVWNTVMIDLPGFKQQIAALHRELVAAAASARSNTKSGNENDE